MTSLSSISLVIPIYNVEAYLPACLESIVAQTRAPDEIIAVDDGSTDDCPAILADYASKLPQMRVIRRQNGGLSAARNTGLDHATGKWLAFLDSDDRLSPRHCELACTMVEDDDLDMALFNGWFDFEGRVDEVLIYCDEPDTKVMSGRDWLLDRLSRRKFFHFVWLHMYRHSFVKEVGLRFIPPWVHEDVPWTTQALMRARRVRYSATPLVHYRKPLRPSNPGPAQDLRLKLLLESSSFNALSLARIVAESNDAALAKAIAWQLVDGGLSIFHYMPKIDSPATLRQLKAKLRHEGLYRTLWHHATTFAQHRRIAKNWLRSFF